MAEQTRPHAFETDDGALRCYLDQLPARCLFCAAPVAPRLIRVAGPLHVWSETARDVIMSRGLGTHYHQMKGKVGLPVCLKCVPPPTTPLLSGTLLACIAALLFYLAVIPVAIACSLASIVLWVIAARRTSLRVGEIDEDDFMFKIHKVEPGVLAEVVALGPHPHPSARGPLAATSIVASKANAIP